MSRTRLIVFAIFIVILGLIAAPTVWAGGLKPGTPVTLAGSAGGQAVLLADLNGDGAQDMVVAECALSQVQIFQGDGSGGFTLVNTITIGGGTVCPQALAADFLTAGSHRDIVVGDNAGEFTVLQEDGNGTFGYTALGPYLVSLTSNVTGVAIADMNGDTKLDVVVADAGNNKVAIYLGNGLQLFVPTVTTSGPYAVGTFPDAVVVADFNNDSKPDVATANFGSNNVTILTTNTVSGTDVTFNAAATSTVGTNPVAIAAGVVGTTGKPDLVVANKASSNVSVILNNGSGVFPASGTPTSVSGNPSGIVLGDFNADGKNDIVVSASDGADILFNNGSGVFPGPSVNFPANNGPAGIAIGTIDGDTRADVAVVNGVSDDVSVLLSTPFSSITSVPVAPNPLEGIAFGPTPVLTFKYDGNPPDTDFTANIDWGDGNANAGTVTLSAGTYTVRGSHTYAEHTPFPAFCGGAATCSISITVDHVVGTPYSDSGTSSANVDDAALHGVSPVLPGLQALNNSKQITSALIGQFTDDNTGAPATDFDNLPALPLDQAKSFVTWGDASATPKENCSSNAGSTPNCVISGAAGSYNVNGTHTFSGSGVFTVTTSIVDVGGSTTTTTRSVSATRMRSLVASALTGPEGTPFANTTVIGNFDTGRPSANATDFTATVDWGDCGPPVNTPGPCAPVNVSSIAANGGTFDVKAGHTYQEGVGVSPAGTTYNVVVVVTDTQDANSTATINSTAKISDAPLTADTTVITLAAAEGAALNSVTVAKFTDGNRNATTADFPTLLANLSIDWGDGSAPSAGTAVDQGCVTTASPPYTPTACSTAGAHHLFSITGSHTFTEGGKDATCAVNGVNPAVCSLTVVVNDIDGSTVTVNTNKANVSDATLTGTAFPINGGIVGVDTFNGTVATWVDANPAATDLTDYPQALPAVTIDFKDGSAVMNCISGGNAPIGTPALAAETCEYFLDSGNASTKTVVARHIYIAKPTLNQTVVTINDKGGASTTVTDTVTVTTIGNVVGPALGAQKEGINTGMVTVATFTSGRGGALASDFNNSAPFSPVNTAKTYIDWGDNTKDACTDNAGNTPNCVISGSAPNFTISGKHTYAEGGLDATAPCTPGSPATCTPSIHIVDNTDASTASANGAVTVADGALAGGSVGAITPPPPPGFIEGNSTGIITVGTFSDENPNATAADFPSDLAHVKITWGDTQSSAGAVTDGGCSTTPTPPYSATACSTPGAFHVFNVTGSHVYAEGGTDAPGGGLYNLSIDIHDTGGSQLLGFASGSIQVNDAPLNNLVVTSIAGGGSGPGGKLVANVDAYAGIVATFHDTNTTPSSTPADFSGNIQWGDGSNTNFTSADVVSLGGGNYQINAPAPGHVFTKAGTQLTFVTVTVNDVGGASVGPTNSAAAPVVTSLINPVPQNVNSTEGTSFSGAVGSFQSTAGGSSFTVNITWGDGNVNPATSVVGGPVWTVSGTNIYTEHTPMGGYCGGAPACPITINVTDNTDGSTLQITGGGATVADAPLFGFPSGLIPSPPPPGFIEGNSTGVITVASFTDANPFATVADFPSDLAHLNIAWGDGGPNSAGTAIDGGCVAGPIPPYIPVPCAPGVFHLFNVTGSHTYAEGGTDAPGGGVYLITLTATDVGGQTTGPFPGSTIQINDAPLTSLVVNTLTGGSGQGGAIVANFDTFVGAVATFHDTNTSPSSTPADFSGNIQWGDGTNTNFTSADVVPLGGGNYQINAPAPGHMFTKAGTQLTFVTVTVNDLGGASVGPANSAAHANVTSLHLPVPANITPYEGVLISPPAAVGTFTATTGNSNFSANITWGDGNNNAAASITGGPTWAVNGSNLYADEDPLTCGAGCPITISVTDNTDGSVLTISGGKANILDAPLTALPAGGLVAQAGQPIVSQVVGLFQDDNSLAPVGDFTTVTVFWNDPNNVGASSTGTLNKLATPPGAPTQFQIIASYVGYSVNGNYQVTYDVVDKGGSLITNGNGVSITNSPGILSGTAKNLSPPSGSLSNAIIASFSNTNSSLPASNYFGTVNWGDGSPVENCSSSSVATPTCYYTQTSPGNFDVIGAHTYLLLGQTFPITVVVNDTIGGQTVTIVSSANIPNIVLTDFLGSTSPPQSLVKAGQLVDVLVTLAPNPNQGPFNSAVHFTGCTILSGPALTGLTCTFSPNSVPDVTQVRQVHVFVQSFGNSAGMQSAPPLGPNNPTQLALLLPGFVGVFGMVLLGSSKKNRRRTALWFGAGLLLLTFLLVGCGGTGLAPANPGFGGTKPGTYLLQINTDAGAASAPCAINGTGPCLTTTVTITQ